ncbi:MAG: thioredoxin domain-containing protein, partial [Clostridiales bacterium]
MKKIILFLAVALIIFSNPMFIYAENKGKTEKTLIYFYSPSCSSCRKLEPTLNNLKKNYPVNIIKYNTSDLKYSKLISIYEDEYNVEKDQKDIIPKLFYKNKYFTGYKDIKINIEHEIKNNNKNISTPILKISNSKPNNLINNFFDFKISKIITAGLLNGISPYSISMILLFLSLILSNHKNILKLGITFCIGKFTVFLFMDTVLYKFLPYVNFNSFDMIFKIIMILFLYILSIINLYDFFVAKNKSYNN